MDSQFKGPRRPPRPPKYNPATPLPLPLPLPPFYGLSKRNTDSLKMEDMLKRKNAELEDTAKLRAIRGNPRETAYDVTSERTILGHIFGAADRHINQRSDRQCCSRMRLGKVLYQMYEACMHHWGVDPDDGIPHSRPGDQQPTQIAIELDASIPENTIICIH